MRLEKDSLGSIEIPADVYYGIQSYRASQNFKISGTQVHPVLIESYLKLKKAAALSNLEVGALDEKKATVIVQAVDQLLNNGFEKHFIVDAYQAGAGTSQNMNTNEVIANVANEIMGAPLGSYQFINPNDHVNMSQSTNDTYPTVMRLATLSLSQNLLHELHSIKNILENKALEFSTIHKAGRTHLQDAVPMTLGDEFAGYRMTVIHLIQLLQQAQTALRELGIGGTAIGTGTNAPLGYKEAMIKHLKVLFTDGKLHLSSNGCSSMQSQLPQMIYSNALRAIALEFTRIANDLRLLSSGPNNGLGEIILPATQPGSSIMPGKINPSILEMGNQVFFKVLGNDTAMAFALQAGQLELNVMMPVMAQTCLESTELLIQSLHTIGERCLTGLQANKERCETYAAQTSQVATILSPVIGYARSAEVVKEALCLNRPVLDLIREKKLLSEEQIKKLFSKIG